MKQDTIWQIVRAYGIEPVNIDPPQSGYRNHTYKIRLANKSTVNLIVYSAHFDRHEQIKAMHSLGRFLHERGLPVRYPLDNRILRLRSAPSPAYACVYNYLPGSTISWESYTKRHIKHLGKSMAELHAHMATFPKPEILPNAHDQHISLIAQMQHYFEREGVVKAMQTKLDITVDSSRFDAFAGVFDELKTAGKLQPLHLDMVRGNVLFDKNKNVTGIIDFEKAAVGHFQLDLARTLAFLHVDCLYKDEAEVTATFLSKGYLRRKLELLGIPHRNISFTSDSLSQLVDYFALYDFYKFLLHNPYESLEQNQHYLRTRDKLLRSGVIGQATKQD